VGHLQLASWLTVALLEDRKRRLACGVSYSTYRSAAAGEGAAAAQQELYGI